MLQPPASIALMVKPRCWPARPLLGDLNWSILTARTAILDWASVFWGNAIMNGVRSPVEKDAKARSEFERTQKG